MSIPGLVVKNYSSYQEYIDHQKSKADHGTPLYKMLLNELWESDCEGFRENFRPFVGMLKDCNNALCLGARTGQEVYVLRELGVKDAIGIDLVSTPPLVIEGDVHSLNFEDLSFDFIFSNIFDHVLFPEKFVSEIKRVMKKNSHCMLHLSLAPDGQEHPDDDKWAANTLRSAEVVIDMFGQDFEVLENRPLGKLNWPTYWLLYIRKLR